MRIMVVNCDTEACPFNLRTEGHVHKLKEMKYESYQLRSGSVSFALLVCLRAHQCLFLSLEVWLHAQVYLMFEFLKQVITALLALLFDLGKGVMLWSLDSEMNLSMSILYTGSYYGSYSVTFALRLCSSLNDAY
ncbi:hypothetical protein Droror1_Dr00018936 [Drosera rotundifolia]